MLSASHKGINAEEVITMACPVNDTTGVCSVLADAGTGIGEFASGLLANGGLVKLILIFAVVAGVIYIFFAIGRVIAGSVTMSHGGKKRY